MKTLTINTTAIEGDTLIMEGENLATILAFVVPEDMTGMHYKLKFRPFRSEVITTDELSAVGGAVSYVLTSAETAAVGPLSVELCGYNEANVLIKSSMYKLAVGDAIGGI